MRYFFLSCLIFLLSAGPVFAQLINPLGSQTTIGTLIGRIIKALLGLSGALALLIFVYGGFMWLISAGDPKKVQKGKDSFVWATIGLVVIFTAYTAVDFVIKALQGTA